MLGDQVPVRTCDKCGHEGRDVIDVPSQTRYPWNGEGKDPNRDHVLCIECGIEVTEQIEYQWAEYYASVM